MTGTIDLSVEQLATIAANVKDEDWAYRPIRVIIHPAADQAVKVETRTLSYGDVLHGYYFVLRNGTRLTGKQFTEYEDARRRAWAADRQMVTDLERDGLL